MAFNWITLRDEEDWMIEYDTLGKRYKISYFRDGHFIDEVVFREYKE